MRLGKVGIRKIVTTLLEGQPRLQAGELAKAAKVTRQIAHRHLSLMVKEGLLIREGQGRGTCYRSSTPRATRLRYPREGLEEERVWDEITAQHSSFADLPENAGRILLYALTEIVNNAIDHSQGTWVEVVVPTLQEDVGFEVIDDGVGIFDHLRSRLDLPDRYAALQELSKGKLTTFPERHSGEGIFFVSKACDYFEVESGDISWKVDNRRGDISVGNVAARNGTRVRCEVSRATRRTLQDLFSQYTEDYEFTKTRIVIKLFETGGAFVSRSEAKRLLNNLERFKEVILDFHGVSEIGQGFSDEVFRVWPSLHPETRIHPVNMCPAVEFMVKRALPKDPPTGARRGDPKP